MATIDQLSGGRVAVHIITGGEDAEMARDGDHLTKDQRYARTDEYLLVMRREWTSGAPFDHLRVAPERHDHRFLFRRQHGGMM